MKKYILSVLLGGAFMFTACSDIIKLLNMLYPLPMLFMII